MCVLERRWLFLLNSPEFPPNSPKNKPNPQQNNQNITLINEKSIDVTKILKSGLMSNGHFHTCSPA